MLQLKPKQQTVIDLINDPSINTIVLIGSVGTGKTDIAAHAALSICYQFPKTRWAVFRQNISTSKRSVIPSYLDMADKMELIEGQDYKYNRQDFDLEFFHNKSKVIFVEADITKDRQARKIKGINATGNHIDEGDELDEMMFTTAMSRRGRRNEFGQPSVSIITMNPNNTYMKTKFYDTWKKGTLPKGVAVVEFTIEDSWQTKQDIEAMMGNSKGWVERYINNNWEFSDDAMSLFKYRYFDGAIRKEFKEESPRYVGYDVAREGNDRSVLSLWYGRMLMDIIVVKDHKEQMTTDDQGQWLIRYMTKNSIIADHISVDGVGVGAGVIDHMHSKGINVRSFKAGAKATKETFDKLRSQVIYEFSQGLEKGTISIYEGCPYRNDLISEAMIHNHTVSDKIVSVESKESIKKRTGTMSPDILDAVVMGLYSQLNLDPKNNKSRIGF